MNWQVFDALGIFLGFTANLIASVAGGSQRDAGPIHGILTKFVSQATLHGAGKLAHQLCPRSRSSGERCSSAGTLPDFS